MSPESSCLELSRRPVIMSQLIFLLVCFIAISTSVSTVSAQTLFTSQRCNYTLFPQTGCEDELGADCVDERCRCKSGRIIGYDERFCFVKNCPAGQYYDEYKSICVAQRRASPSVAESHCRYDFHCLGSHVRCKLYGWNRNCVCDPGFIFGYNGTCIPMHGIGGHCAHDSDCDDTAVGHRKMFCRMKDEYTSNEGTCQCLDDHTYNYNVDGCESNERIRERKSNMRMLIILFVIAGSIFGFALTFNFGMLGATPRGQAQAILLKRLAEEKERQERQQVQLKTAEEGTATVPSAPPSPPAMDAKLELTLTDSQKKSADDKAKLIAL